MCREEKYSTVEKECLGVKLRVQAFQHYGFGRQFVIEINHQALEWLDQVKKNNPRRTRWSLLLQPYQYTVKYRPRHLSFEEKGGECEGQLYILSSFVITFDTMSFVVSYIVL